MKKFKIFLCNICMFILLLMMKGLSILVLKLNHIVENSKEEY